MISRSRAKSHKGRCVGVCHDPIKYSLLDPTSSVLLGCLVTFMRKQWAQVVCCGLAAQLYNGYVNNKKYELLNQM